MPAADRVAAVRRDRLFGDVGGEYVLGNGVEQPVLIPEQPVNGRRLHAGRHGDGTGGDGRRARAGQVLAPDPDHGQRPGQAGTGVPGGNHHRAVRKNGEISRTDPR
jgi:hypothetical protein